MSMQKLIRPAKFAGGKRPSFAAAYAKAVNRYQFSAGIFPSFAWKDHAVVRVLQVDDIDHGTKVDADSIEDDMEYLVPVTIGTPGVVLNLNFDTGSSDLWMWSTQTRNASRAQIAQHSVYDPAKSSTDAAVAGSWSITFGDGSSAKGTLRSDTVTIGDIVVKGQTIQLATEVSRQFLNDTETDGLLGLAFPKLNTARPKQAATPMVNMMKQNLLATPVFTCALGRNEEPGFYSFGYIDPNVTPNRLTYVPVNSSRGWWQVPSTSYSINGKVVERPGNTCILDTGTTLTLVDDTVLSHIYGAIPGAVFDHNEGGWKYPVDAAIPELSFAVGDKLYKINPKDMSYAEPFNGFYFGGFQSRGDMDMDIFGDSFLKAVYAVFNQGENTVGLAQRDD